MARVIAICNQKGGVGKCLAPETPVLLSNGKTLPIERIFEEYQDGYSSVIFDEEGGVFVKPKSDLRVISLNSQLKLTESSVQALYRGKANRLLEVGSSKGKSVRVTARHPFLVLRNGVQEWVRADRLRNGDFIATPRSLGATPLNFNSNDLMGRIPDAIYVRLKSRQFVSLHMADILSHSNFELKDRILWELFQEKQISASRLYALATRHAVSRHLRFFLRENIIGKEKGRGREHCYFLRKDSLLDYIHGRGFSIRILEKFGWEKSLVADFHYRKAGYDCGPMAPIFEIDQSLAEFVSLVLAEGYLGGSRIIFFNNSSELVDCFVDYCKKIGMKCNKKHIGSQWKVTVNSAGTLMKFLEGTFEVPVHGSRKSSRVVVPSAIMQASEPILAAYLGAYIDCEGYVAKDRSTLVISSASEENIIRLHYAFLRFGINGRLRRFYAQATNSRKPKKREYYSLTITGAPGLAKISQQIPIMISYKRQRIARAASIKPNTNVDVLPVGELLKMVRKEFHLTQREIGIQGTITDYEDGSYLPSQEAVQKIVSVIEQRQPVYGTESYYGKMAQLASADIFWERITSITSIDYEGYVYDLTVQDTHNFVAGKGAFFVHNTTTSLNLGAYLALAGRRVLLIDFDPQANASSALGHHYSSVMKSIYHGIINAATHEEIILQTPLRNYHLVPGSPHLAGALVELVDLPEREYFLRKFVNRVRHLYDYILIDLPPSLSLLTVNGLVAADEVIIPVQAEYYSLEGIGQLLETVDMIRGNLGHPLSVSGALITMYNKREHLSREVAKNLREHFPYRVFQAEIPRSVALAEAPSYGLPIILYRPDSSGAAAYKQLAEEIMAEEKG